MNYKAFHNIMVILCIFLFIAGCKPEVVCNKPYILVGTSCCLDKDDNSICDSDEAVAPVVVPAEQVNETVQPVVENMSLETVVETINTVSNVSEVVKKTFSVDSALDSVVLVEMLVYDDKLQKDGRVLSSGTGFFVSPDGHIITNMHVVSPFGFDLSEFDVRFRVKTNSETYYDVDLIDWNYDYDIALLKLKEKKTKMRFLEFGSSKSLKQGDEIYVLGNPLGLEQSVSKGIVSSTGRPGMHNESLKVYVQTDAAVNRGNSGGPMLNSDGLVVGIATWGYGWQNAGLNFGLESDSAKRIYDIMKQVKSPIPTAPLERCYLGKTGSIAITSSYGFDELSTKFSFQKPTKLNVFYDSVKSELDFNRITLSFQNKDTVSHDVCFSIKIISDAKVVLEKKLDSFTVKPSMTLSNQDITIGFTTPYLIQWYYYELTASDCDTKEQYYSFYRRDEYTDNYESGDADVFAGC